MEKKIEYWIWDACTDNSPVCVKASSAEEAIVLANDEFWGEEPMKGQQFHVVAAAAVNHHTVKEVISAVKTTIKTKKK